MTLDVIRGIQLGIYLKELRHVTGVAASHLLAAHEAGRAWRRMSDLEQAREADGEPERMAPSVKRRILEEKLYYSAEAMLAAYARASLLLFPGAALARRTRVDRHAAADRRDKRVLRGADLRKLLEIDEHHAISRRELRDSWMHADERIDELIANHTIVELQGYFRDGVLGPAGHQHYLRVFEMSDTDVLLSLNGQSYSLTEISQTLGDVYERATRAENAASYIEWQR